ncbi:restriction endonuclease subunit S [Streptomyces cellulosae]
MTDIPDGWIESTLGDFVALRRGRDLPNRVRRAGTVPVIGSGGLTGWHDTPAVAGPGLTIGRAANLGVPTLVEEDFWPLNTTLYVEDFRGNDVRFAYYLFQSIELGGYDSGSVQPMLNRNYIRNYPIVVPKPPEQRAISEVLSTLDRKIDSNERVETASVNLAEARLQAVVAEDEESEKVPLGAAAKWLSGGTPKTDVAAYWDGDIPWISAASLTGFLLADSTRRVTELGAQSGTRMAPSGATICVVRGMSLKTEFRLGIAQRPVAFGQDCKALIATESVGPHILGYALRAKRDEVLGMVDEAGHGTGRLDTKLLASLELDLPRREWRPKVEEELEHFTSGAAARQRESTSLLALRDFLVPRLIFGKMRTKVAEQIVGEVA